MLGVNHIRSNLLLRLFMPQLSKDQLLVIYPKKQYIKHFTVGNNAFVMIILLRIIDIRNLYKPYGLVIFFSKLNKHNMLTTITQVDITN